MFKGNIATWECVALIGCVSVVPLILTVPTFVSENYGTASFLHAIYMSIIVGLVFLILFSMYSKFKKQTLLDIANNLGGKTLMYFTGLLMLIYIMLTTIITLGEFTENINDILFNDAPRSYIGLLFSLAILLRITYWRKRNL